MTSRLLAGVAVVLGGLVLLSQSRRADPPPESDSVPVAAVIGPMPEPTARRARVELYPVAPGVGVATPAIDLRARLAVRRRIAREGTRVYLDSLLVHTDSAVVRWPDRKRAALRVRIEPDTALPQWSPSIIDAVRGGMLAWNGNPAGIQLVEATDSLPVDITVRFTEALGTSEFGATDLSWDNMGEVTAAVVRIAIRPDSRARNTLPPPVLRRVTAHEFGHALGLPHSDDRHDLMYFNSPVDGPSRRDQATLLLLYAVPPGSLKEP